MRPLPEFDTARQLCCHQQPVFIGINRVTIALEHVRRYVELEGVSFNQISISSIWTTARTNPGFSDLLLERCWVSGSGYMFYMKVKGQASRGENYWAFMSSTSSTKFRWERHIFPTTSFPGQSYILAKETGNMLHSNFDTPRMFHPRMSFNRGPKISVYRHIQYGPKLQQIFLMFLSFVSLSIWFFAILAMLYPPLSP